MVKTVVQPVDMSVKANQLAVVKAQITNMISAHHAQSLRQYNASLAAIFRSKTYSGQDVCDAFGPAAANLLSVLEGVQSLLNTIINNSAIDMPKYVKNDDGTVTMGNGAQANPADPAPSA